MPILTFRRRWIPRFGVRTLLIAVTALCVLLGGATLWYRMHESEHDRQMGVVQRLRLVGAQARWRATAPDWIIESEYFGESPSINQLGLFRVLEFVEEVRCLPEADIGSVIDLLCELPRTSELSINIASLNPEVVARLAALAQLRELTVDYYRYPEWIDDPRYQSLVAGLRLKLPGVHIQQAISVSWKIDEPVQSNRSSTAQQ